VAEIMNRLATDVAVEYSTFTLVDPDGQAPVPWPQRVDEEAGDGTVTANPNRVDFRSVAEFHRASVVLSTWDGPPAPPEGDWEDDHEVAFESESGQVMLCGLTSGCGRTFRIGPARHLYGLKVYCGGRERTIEADSSGPVPAGSEWYDMRFWPIRALEVAGPGQEPGPASVSR
jgi:hypothetical protein